MLSVFEILSINTVLVTALVGIWTIFLKKDTVKSLRKFKTALKDYEKKNAKDLFEKIRGAEKERDVTKAMEKISEYTDDWSYVTEAVSILKNKENKVYNYGKYAIVLFAGTFLFGLYISDQPEIIFTGDITRIAFLHFLFALEILLIFYWIWLIFDFSRILNEISEGETEDIEKRIMKTVEGIKKEEASSS